MNGSRTTKRWPFASFAGLGLSACFAAGAAAGELGACCFDDGTCTDTTRLTCQVQLDTTFQGEGTSCAAGDCHGACCTADNSCTTVTTDTCTFVEGVFQGFGTACRETDCLGACCARGGSCLDVSEAACGLERGVFHGTRSDCSALTCTGACCTGVDDCLETSEPLCRERGGAFGRGRVCDLCAENGPPALCRPPLLTIERGTPRTVSNVYSGPTVVYDGLGAWVAAWVTIDFDGQDLLFARSTDGGLTWTEPQFLNSHAERTTLDHYNVGPSLISNGKGTILAVWWGADDTIPHGVPSEEIWLTFSQDGGRTWAPQQPLSPIEPVPITWSHSDRNATVATDTRGTWIAVWQTPNPLDDTIGNDHDLFVAVSTGDVSTWTFPANLNTNAPRDTGEDNNPALATDGAGLWTVVWDSSENLDGAIGDDRDILVAQSTDNGQSWSPPAVLNTNAAEDGDDDDRRPVLVAAGRDTWIAAWEVDVADTGTTVDDVAWSKSVDNGQTWSPPTPVPATNIVGGPMLATDRRGRILMAWRLLDRSNGTTHGSDVLFTMSADRGASWTPPQALNTDPKLQGEDFFHSEPAADADGLGNWLAVWGLNDTVEKNLLTTVIDARPSDCNLNGVLDECEDSIDADGDGKLGLSDHRDLPVCLTGPNATFVYPCCRFADADANGHVDLRDYAQLIGALSGTADPP